MNKTDFINALAKELAYPEDTCIMINEILENNFFIGKRNKNKIIDELAQKLNASHEDAAKIYDTAVTVINREIAYKCRHPFKSQD